MSHNDSSLSIKEYKDERELSPDEEEENEENKNDESSWFND